VVSFAPLLLMCTLHLFGGGGEAFASELGRPQAGDTACFASLSCVHSSLATSAIETAHPDHEPIFAFEPKTEKSDQDDETRILGSSGSDDDGRLNASRSKTRHGIAHDLLAGVDPVCAHAPRGPPLA
jgi:hypothetical protein